VIGWISIFLLPMIEGKERNNPERRGGGISSQGQERETECDIYIHSILVPPAFGRFDRHLGVNL
jgi:hypothetical protein